MKTILLSLLMLCSISLFSQGDLVEWRDNYWSKVNNDTLWAEIRTDNTIKFEKLGVASKFKALHFINFTPLPRLYYSVRRKVYYIIIKK